MTEAQWLACDDPEAMLALAAGWQRLASARKLRLFACACARLLWPYGLRPQEPCVIDAAERMAEDPAGRLDDPESVVPHAAKAGLAVLIEGTGRHAAVQWCDFGGRDDDFVRRQAALLREIIDNPYRPVTLPPSKTDCPKRCRNQRGDSWIGWRSHNRGTFYCVLCDTDAVLITCPWLTPTVCALARATYEERLPNGTLDSVRLAILADALEEVGCDSEELLRHLRGEEPLLRELHRQTQVVAPPSFRQIGWRPLPGPHVRGCWALDLLLGKE